MVKNTPKKVFQDEKNNPIVFYFRPCAARSRIHPIVEEHGGQITARFALNAIKLANDEDYLVSDDYYSVRYIEDCVKANKLLEKDKYKLQPRRMVIRDASDEEVSDISIDDDAPLKLVANSKYLQGRKTYKYKEDMEILNFIIKENYHDRVGGNTIWEEMEALEITKHSGPSMNSRFRKNLKFNLHLYPIPLKDKLKLNPHYEATSQEKKSPPEQQHKPATPQKEAGKECEPTSPATQVLPRTPKTSTPMKQNIETAQSKHKHGLTSPSPQKVASEEKSKYFSESISDNSGEASNTIIIKRSKGKVALQFVTGTKKQIPVADKQDSPSKLNTAQSDGERSSHRLSSEKPDDLSQVSPMRKRGRPRKTEDSEKPDDLSQGSPMRKRGRPRKTEDSVEKSPKLDITPSKTSDRLRKRMMNENEDKNTEPQIESSPSKLKKKDLDETRSSSRTRKPPQRYLSSSPQKELQKKSESTEVTRQSDKGSSSPPKQDKRSHKTLYRAEGSTLTPSQVNNGVDSPGLKGSKITSVDCMFKKSNTVTGGDGQKTIPKSKPEEAANCLDDSVDADELEDDFDKELMKRVAKTSTQVSDDEAGKTPDDLSQGSPVRKRERLRKIQDPAPKARLKSKIADKEQNGEKNLASEGPRPGKNLSKQTEKARQKSGSPKKKTRTSYVTVFDDDDEDIVTEIAPEKMETENMMKEAELKDLINKLCSEYQLTVYVCF
ncbi:uncharacterized protein LOC111137832 isoform X3 [Crassostrea virginica]